MCIAFVSYKNHPQYDLIIAHNRDEFFNRKTQAAHYWSPDHKILGGKDLVSGGSWLALSKQGRIAFVTNHRTPNIKPGLKSRGSIIHDFVTDTSHPEQFLKTLNHTKKSYNPFNLLTFDHDNAWFLASHSDTTHTRLSPSYYALSNASLDTPWPKVRKLKERAIQILQNSKKDPSEELFEILKDQEKAKDEELPKTGIDPSLEKALSSIFINIDGYGTRSSTILLIDKEGRLSFKERTYSEEGTLVGTFTERMQVPTS